MNVVYLEPVPEDVESIVRECLPSELSLRVLKVDEKPEDVVADADFLLVATTKVTPSVLDAAPKLKHIQHQGVGYNNIDLDAARAKGVTIGLTPEGTSIPVAEHVFLLILSLYRKLFEARQSLRDGKWLQWELRPHSYDLVGKTVGIVGLGRIGRELTTRLRAFGCEVFYTDAVRVSEAEELHLGAVFTDLDDLLQRSDIVSLHVPLLPETRNLVGTRELALMKSNAILINAARGGLIDEKALEVALNEGQISGAGLDVFEQEPPPKDHPLLFMDNVVAVPHIAAGTRDAYATKMRAAFANMQRVARGEDPINQVEL
ncbi:MAG: phosphoglycerate dehydrogenase-like enzyme [Candidatus Latescibacterota bacterium]|jgi:phosphoglycerate dehydrogenase-like enzyme